jgi:integrase
VARARLPQLAQPHLTADRQTVGLPAPRPYGLRGSYLSLLAAAGLTLLEVARHAGHSVDTCERYYAKIFDDIDPAKRVSPEDQILAAREPGVTGVERLFDAG